MTIPTELKDRKQWIGWKYGELREDGKKAKVPKILGTSHNAKVNDPTTWSAHQDAKRLGYVFTKEDGIAGIDLDNCIDAEGKVLPWAQDVIDMFGSYAEYSPSGTGVHILVRSHDILQGLHRGGVEIYSHGRYFTITGNQLEGTPETIEPRQEVLKRYHAQVSSTRKVAPPVKDKWAALAKGNWKQFGYESQSEADLALANHLMAVHGGDRQAAEAAFRESALFTGRENQEVAESKLEFTFNAASAGRPKLGRGYTLAETIETYGDLKWTWENWIPRGHVTMIAGATGVGKSYLAAALLAAKAGYGLWPDRTSVGGTGNVLLCETEGMKGEYGRRLVGLGCDGSGGEVVFGPQMDEWEAMMLDDETFDASLKALVREWSPVMFIVDSFSGGHGLKENDAMMRKLLQRCAVWASSFDIPVILVHHERKRHEQESAKTTIDRIRGHTVITQFCRSVIGIWRGSEEGEVQTARVEVIKSNFAATPPPLGMMIVGGKPKFVTAPRERAASGAPAALLEAIEFLQETLSGGPVPIAKIKRQAVEQDISKGTLERARRKLETQKEKVGKRWCWVLPSEIEIVGLDALTLNL